MATTPDTTAYSQLTDKQRAFVDALCTEPNISGQRAAIIAGYGKAGAAQEAYRLLRNAYVRRALGEQLKDTAPTPEEIAAHWDRVSRATLDDFYTKVKIAYCDKVQKPLQEIITALLAEMEFEETYANRAKLDGDDLEAHQRQQKHRSLKVLRLQIELERNANAYREVDGPTKYRTELQLDLVKAQKAGVLDLARAIKPTQHGLGIELRDPDAALDKLARMAGAYEKDNEQSATKITGVGITVRRATEKGGTNAA
jgi:phage terminase small subunit